MLVTFLCVRAYDAWRAPPLKLWHTFVPHELDAKAIDAADWQSWLAAEDSVFAEVSARVTGKLPAEDQLRSNRYFAGGLMYPAKLTTDWNRSYVLMPKGPLRGAVVLLHGLTDSPYSLRHIAAEYRARGFVAVGVRMPGHGTVPGALTMVRWEDWLAAARLAVRHARELAGPGTPLHVVGYSNGGALALKYTLDSLDDPTLAHPDQLVLVSPMIGITSMARFAGVLGWPAVFPAFAKAAWLDTLPEYNPFKYNSFPVNGARQSSQLVRAVERQIAADFADGKLGNLPPVLTFQSVLDATVSTRAVFDAFYRYLPDKHGHEVVLFDRNRRSMVEALVRPALVEPLTGILPETPRNYSVTLVTNGTGGGTEARTFPSGSRSVTLRPLAEAYPPDLYSLSHVSLPFPPTDGLYGYGQPDIYFGINLGTVSARGERGTLIVNAETLMRASCNPFFEYLLLRIDATLVASR